MATHFPVADDMVECALNSIRQHCDWVVFDKEYPNNGNFT